MGQQVIYLGLYSLRGRNGKPNPLFVLANVLLHLLYFLLALLEFGLVLGYLFIVYIARNALRWQLDLRLLLFVLGQLPNDSYIIFLDPYEVLLYLLDLIQLRLALLLYLLHLLLQRRDLRIRLLLDALDLLLQFRYVAFQSLRRVHPIHHSLHLLGFCFGVLDLFLEVSHQFLLLGYLLL